MLKISQVEASQHPTLLKLEGRVVGPWVSELRQVCEAHLTEGRSLKLDLTDVTFVDAEGVGLLTGFKTRDVILQNCSPFVGEQLRSIVNCR